MNYFCRNFNKLVILNPTVTSHALMSGMATVVVRGGNGVNPVVNAMVKMEQHRMLSVKVALLSFPLSKISLKFVNVKKEDVRYTVTNYTVSKRKKRSIFHQKPFSHYVSNDIISSFISFFFVEIFSIKNLKFETEKILSL